MEWKDNTNSEGKIDKWDGQGEGGVNGLDGRR